MSKQTPKQSFVCVEVPINLILYDQAGSGIVQYDRIHYLSIKTSMKGMKRALPGPTMWHGKHLVTNTKMVSGVSHFVI